ncbi:hypothetical protein ES703_74603 [subsurface metagenome]
MGIRNLNSLLDRKVLLHEAEDGGYATARFLAVVDEATGNIEIYNSPEPGYYARYQIICYWTGVTWHERWIELAITEKAEQETWVPRNLKASDNIPEGAVCHALLTNAAVGNEEIVGCRTHNSSLERKLAIHEAEGGGHQRLQYVRQNL